jgi:hypothetical protein
MKSLTTKLMIAAAALVTASAASAQVMQADIPFAFQAGGKVMAAGTYRVDLHGLGGTVIISDTQRQGVVTALPVTRADAKDTNAKIVFTCSRGLCTLLQVWPGANGTGLTFPAPKRNRDEEASLAVIGLRPDAAE